VSASAWPRLIGYRWDRLPAGSAPVDAGRFEMALRLAALPTVTRCQPTNQADKDIAPDGCQGVRSTGLTVRPASISSMASLIASSG
jgi:hypothetical protein